MNKEEFYERVAHVLGVEHEFKEQYPYKRRWGQRALGNGRYEGHGVVRWFSKDLVHVMMTDPIIVGTFVGEEADVYAILAIDDAMREQHCDVWLSIWEADRLALGMSV